MEQIIVVIGGGLLTALISALVALVVARWNAAASEARLRLELTQSEERLRHEFAMESSLESAVNALMSKGFALRSFNLIRHHLRGFKDDELRQLLIRSGCICFKVINDKEFWGLLSENENLLKERKSMERHGLKFYDLDEDDDVDNESPDGPAA